MRMKRLDVLRVCLAGMLAAGGSWTTARAAGWGPAAGQDMVTLSGTLGRSAGVDPATGTAYVRLYLMSQDGVTAGSFDATRPTLTVECTKRRDGRMGFGMSLSYSGVVDTAFHPMKSLHDGTPHFDRRMDQREVTFEFLGYTRVKPMKRQFVVVSEPTGSLVYNPPGLHSYNMEEAAYHLQYLRALPTFRTTYSGLTATFETAPLLEQIRREGMCGASHL